MPQIFPIATRSPGVTVSGNKVVPAQAAGNNYLVQVNIAQADLDDTTVSFALEMYVSPDGGATFPPVGQFNAAISFTGGPNQGKGGTATVAPGWQQPGSEVAGKTVRFRLNNTGRAVDLGLDANQI